MTDREFKNNVIGAECMRGNSEIPGVYFWEG